MGSRERIVRQRQDLRCSILTAGWDIVKKDGWPALSMRKIADAIEYTAPAIYGCFENKEALLMEFTINGHRQLGDRLKKVKRLHQLPAMQLEAMWLEYWAFAFDEKEYYQLMFGVEVNCCELVKIFPPADLRRSLSVKSSRTWLIRATIRKQMCAKNFILFGRSSTVLSASIL